MRYSVGSRHKRQIGVRARHVLHGGITRFLQRQGVGGVGDNDATDGHPNALRVRHNCNRVVGTGKFHDGRPLESALCGQLRDRATGPETTLHEYDCKYGVAEFEM
jgi:hypothetical protein